MVTGTCSFCGKGIEQDRIAFRDECPHCDEGLHACVQCAHYAPGKPYDCNEPNVDEVRNKEKNNICDWFKFGDQGKRDTGLSASAADDLLKKLLSDN